MEVSPNRPGLLYLATHQGLFLAGLSGFAERVSTTADNFQTVVRLPGAPRVLYGSGRAAWGGNLGVIISGNGGKTWSRLSSGNGRPVAFNALAISAADHTVVYGADEGFRVSRDGGRTWRMQLAPPERIFDLAASSRDAAIVFAAAADGLWRSSDSGATWQRAHPSAREATMVHITPEGRIFAFLIGEGLVAAQEPSAPWTVLNNNFGRFVVLRLAADPGEPRRLFAVTDNSEVMVSEDGGRTWRTMHSQGRPPRH